MTDAAAEPASPLVRLPVLVRDLMTAEVVTVEPTATVKEMAHVMIEHDLRSVPVVDVGDVLVGVVGESDLISRECYPAPRRHHLAELVADAAVEHRHRWNERAEGLTAGEIMTADMVTCRPDEPVAAATRRMLRMEVRSLPVVDGDGLLVGVLSRRDVLRLFDRPDDEIRSTVAAVLADPLWSPEGHQVEAHVHDSVVTLAGTVPAEADIAVVAAAVGQVAGVTEVVNHLAVLAG
jgi:CBS domain-containing protein